MSGARALFNGHDTALYLQRKQTVHICLFVHKESSQLQLTGTKNNPITFTGFCLSHFKPWQTNQTLTTPQFAPRSQQTKSYIDETTRDHPPYSQCDYNCDFILDLLKMDPNSRYVFNYRRETTRTDGNGCVTYLDNVKVTIMPDGYYEVEIYEEYIPADTPPPSRNRLDSMTQPMEEPSYEVRESWDCSTY